MSDEPVSLLWLDLEMTGLNPETDRILEAALILTDHHHESLATLEEVVFQPPEVLEAMDPWCKKHHGESGLTARVAQGISESDLDEKIRNILDQHVPKGRPVLAGNSIAQDRRFVDRYLPKTAQRLHYRMLDVSSWKIVFESRFGVKYEKKNQHRALEDIRESMAELEFYLAAVDPNLLGLSHKGNP